MRASQQVERRNNCEKNTFKVWRAKRGTHRTSEDENKEKLKKLRMA
jgi:hypothetical protein